MDLGITGAAKRALSRLKKFRLPILFAALGVVLLLLPMGKPQATSSTERATAADQAADESRLASILKTIDGVGAVQVMLTLKNDGRTEFQTDVRTTVRDSESETHAETVFSGGSHGDALIRSVTRPEYRGALIVCRGAGDPQVRLDLIRAVGSLTGLTSDKITVLKMKG